MANKAVIAQKEAKVKELSETLKNSKLVLLVDYRGTTVEDDTKLRKDLREAKGCAKVVKNNILKRALEMNNESELDDLLEGPVAVVTAEEDYLAPLKVVYKFTTKHDNYKIKGGIIDGKVMSVEDIVTLAKLPSREELLSSLAGSLLGIISKFAVAINQVKELKEKEEGAPAPTEEVKEEAAEEVKEEATEEVKEEAKVDETPKAE